MFPIEDSDQRSYQECSHDDIQPIYQDRDNSDKDRDKLGEEADETLKEKQELERRKRKGEPQ